MKQSNKLILFMLITLLVLIVILQRGADEYPKLCINEIMPNSDSIFVERSAAHREWVEIFNGTSEAVNMSGYGLSDRMDEPFKWRFPEGTVLQPEKYLLVYTTGGQSEGEGLYASFGLNSEGETILLTDKSGEVIDTFTYGTSYTNYSYGRIGEDGQPALLKKATPGKGNIVSVSVYYRDKNIDLPIVFSHESGGYATEFMLELVALQDAVIYYTTDCTTPDLNSQRYKEPIRIYDRSDEENRFADIRAGHEKQRFVYRGSDPVKKAMIIKARVYQDGRLADNIETRSYFVGHSDKLMTVSLTTEPDDLFGFDRGIYVPGRLYAEYVYTDPKAPLSNVIGNFTVTGEESERKASVEFFSEERRLLLRQDMGVRISGGLRRSSLPDKNLRLYASQEYGKSELDFPYFSQSEISSSAFRRIQLRTSSEFYREVFQDVFVATLFLDEDMGVQAAQPAVLYLNGEFWGLTNIQERVDEYFVEAHFSIKLDNITMLKSDTNMLQKMKLVTGTEKDLKDYLALFDFAATHDMSQESNYQYIADRVDIDSFIKSCMARIFSANRDWPDNNLRVFRARETGDGRFEDGKWRYLLYDLDYAFEDYRHNTIQYALGNVARELNWGSNKYPSAWSLDLFKGLMNNRQFRSLFLAQYEEYRQTIFQPDYLENRLDSMIGEYGSLIEEHADRWVKKTDHTKPGGWLPILAGENVYEREDIDGERKKLYDFAEKRLEYLDEYMRATYRSYGEQVLYE